MANYKTSWVQRLIEGAWQKTFAFSHAKTVYTDFANKKTLADKLSEIDTEIGNKANKTELPTELPANGGNSATVNGHTVKSDVPENAVFTDTVYDDTEIQKRISDVRKETTVNLLNPTLQSTTRNGVTCTNNGDGTYTFKGTATENIEFQIAILTLKPGQYKYFGSRAYVRKTDMTWVKSVKTGDIVSITEDNPVLESVVYIHKGDSIDKTIPFMTTTNLNATIDDFVPYTGDTGSLNGDVADLRSDVDGMGITHKHSFFEPAVVNVTNNSYTYDFYLKDGYDFNDLIDGNGCGLAMVYINNGHAIKGSYGMLLLLSISPRLNAPDMISMIYGRTTGPGMNVTKVEYCAASYSKKGFRVIASSSPSAPVDTLKALYTNVASWTNICNM